MRHIYIAIIIFFAVYNAAVLCNFFVDKEEIVFKHNFSSEAEVMVRPDQARIRINRLERFGKTPTEAAASVAGPVERFLEKISEPFELVPFSLSFGYYKNSQFVSRAYSGNLSVDLIVTDFSRIAGLLETALNSGMNDIEDANFIVSDSALKAGRDRARQKAREQIFADAAIFARQMGKKLVACVPPALAFGQGYGSGDPSVSGGLSTNEVPDLMDISSFIRPISELIIEEPPFSGTVQVAKTVIPSEVPVSESDTLACEFD